MTNKWIEHVKTFSKKNNISYACALSMPQCKESYKPVVKKNKPGFTKEETEEFTNNFVKTWKTYKKENNYIQMDNIRQKFSRYGDEFKKDLSERYPNIYKKILMSKHDPNKSIVEKKDE